MTTPGSATEPLPLGPLLTEMVRALVTTPSAVSVEERQGPDRAGVPSTFLVIHAAPPDRERVIGRGGRTVSAMRLFFGMVGGRRGTHVYIEVANSPNPRELRADRSRGTEGALRA